MTTRRETPLLVEGDDLGGPVPVSPINADSLPSSPRDMYAPLSPANNQSPAQARSPSSVGTDNKMPAVQPSYTAGVGSPDLLESTRDLTELVSRLTDFVSASDSHPFGPEDAANAVRYINRYVEETASVQSALKRDLSTKAAEVKELRFLAAIGDHAGAVCDLFTKKIPANSPLKPIWTKLLPMLEQQRDTMNKWETSGSLGPRPLVPAWDAFRNRVENLVAEGLTDMDVDIALLAARTYARRNSTFHGNTYDLFKSGQFAKLADRVELDDKNLASLLPDEEKPLEDQYKRLIGLNRDSRISKDDSGDWRKRQAPSLPPSLPRGEIAVSAAMDLGKYRPPGLSGPPLPGLFADITSMRRHTEPDLEQRGIKRPAEEQPPGQPQTKILRGLGFVKDEKDSVQVEAKNSDISDDEYTTMKTWLLQVQQTAEDLISIAPKSASKLIDGIREKLISELDQAKQALAKKKRQTEKKERGPRPQSKNSVDDVSFDTNLFD